MWRCAIRINNFISLTESDLGPIYEEFISIYDSFIATATSEEESKLFERMFRQEYPTLIKLKELAEAMLVGQQNTRNFERIRDPEKKVAKIRKFKLIKKDPPDELA
jgi:hypothetical protein